MPLSFKIVDPHKDTRWDAFVVAHPHGTIYHHSAWLGVLESAFGHTPFCIGAEDEQTGQLTGVLPFFLIQSWLTGKRLVSLPTTGYCNPLMPASMLKNALAFAREKLPYIDSIELRCQDGPQGESQAEPSAMPGIQKDTSYVTHILDLQAPLDNIFASFHQSGVRRRIKKAERSGLTLRMADDESDLKRFYELETEVRRKHGLPPHPYRFFEKMWQVLTPRGMLCMPVIEHQGQIIAAAIMLSFKGTMTYEYGASDSNFLQLCPNHKMFWDMIQSAHTQGMQAFDFGRTAVSHTSLITFKQRWGAKQYDLAHHYFLKGRKFNTSEGMLRNLLGMVNRHLSAPLLNWEGQWLFRHIS